ncbi:MAG: hypothetical protein FWF96_06230 [Kiritimatiellaeota bacterium]|nr:hypothetical protein [Kiritimatiellota bacterium]
MVEVLRKRFADTGIKNKKPVVRLKEDGFIIDWPSADAEHHAMAERSIESVMFLEFRLVHKDNDPLASELLTTRSAPTGFVKHESGFGYVPTADYARLCSDLEYHQTLSRFGCERIPNHVMMLEKTSRRGLGVMYVPTFVSNHRELTGAELKSARCFQNEMTDDWSVDIKFNKNGATLFKVITSKYKPHGSENPINAGRRLAIIVDGVLYSAPVIQTEIPDGRAHITGTFTEAEAWLLDNALNSGALPVPLKIVEKRVIDPRVGATRSKPAVDLSGRSLEINSVGRSPTLAASVTCRVKPCHHIQATRHQDARLSALKPLFKRFRRALPYANDFRASPYAINFWALPYASDFRASPYTIDFWALPYAIDFKASPCFFRILAECRTFHREGIPA